MSENYFKDLFIINVNENKKAKGKFDYLSWVFAWAEIKKQHPLATYKVYETPAGLNYWDDKRTAWVKTSVSVYIKVGECLREIEHTEYLPIMDFSNKSMPIDKITSFDVNKAIQRSLTKACARHGIGLYVYAGEDLPEEKEEVVKQREQGYIDFISKAKTVQELTDFYKANSPLSQNIIEAMGAKKKEILDNENS